MIASTSQEFEALLINPQTAITLFWLSMFSTVIFGFMVSIFLPKIKNYINDRGTHDHKRLR